MRFWALGLISILVLLPHPVAATVDPPDWTMGSWYRIDHGLAVSFQEEQGSAGILLSAVDSRWTYLRDEVRQLDSTGSSYPCRVLEISGEVIGLGSLDLVFPEELAFPLEIRAGQLDGALFVQQDRLEMVAREIRIQAQLWGQPWGSAWVHLGALTVDWTEEHDPPLDLFGFPIELGGTWSQMTSESMAGTAGLNISIFGIDLDLMGRLEPIRSVEYVWSTEAQEQVESWATYRSMGIEADGSGTIQAWYAPEAEWLVKLQRAGIPVGETGASLAGETLQVTDLQVGPPPTPTPAGIGVDLRLAAGHFTPGTLCWLEALCYNDGPDRAGVPLLVLLDVHGQYFFWPSWGQYPPQIDYQSVGIPNGGTWFSIIPEFTWPDTGSDALGGLFFYGAMLNESMDELWGAMDVEEFSFGPG